MKHPEFYCDSKNAEDSVIRTFLKHEVDSSPDLRPKSGAIGLAAQYSELQAASLLRVASCLCTACFVTKESFETANRIISASKILRPCQYDAHKPDNESQDYQYDLPAAKTLLNIALITHRKEEIEDATTLLAGKYTKILQCSEEDGLKYAKKDLDALIGARENIIKARIAGSALR